jgi:hypothetical protein
MEMRMSDRKFFLIVYDRQKGQILEMTDFSAAEGKRALEVRFAREKAERNSPEVEVVVLGARSREDLMKTHSRYFKSVRELVEDGG